MTTKSVIDIKYDSSDEEFVKDLVYQLDIVFDRNSIFNTHSWGGGFSTTNFRHDNRYIYCDLVSDFLTSDSIVYQTSEAYIRGVIAGYLQAKCLEIL
jgi:hypothetical protein